MTPILTLCPGCRKPQKRSGQCPQCKARQRTVYNSPQWKIARTYAIRNAGNQCEHCGATTNLDVHHRTPINQGGEPYALTNLVALCRRCHLLER